MHVVKAAASRALCLLLGCGCISLGLAWWALRLLAAARLAIAQHLHLICANLGGVLLYAIFFP